MISHAGTCPINAFGIVIDCIPEESAKDFTSVLRRGILIAPLESAVSCAIKIEGATFTFLTNKEACCITILKSCEADIRAKASLFLSNLIQRFTELIRYLL
ncbi:hypothetical protein TNCT_148261 [Trichonephila clavata]|uniref:Uncharacterized protein n=1 Tax=Trichonephila clavata TaxID=2740835 RepID=A0A8X6KS65_TRICU|nr:hypothetical protein TNCT_148261 [Trichonephila clavata]